MWLKTSAVWVGTASAKGSSLISSVLEWHDHWNPVYNLLQGQDVLCLNLTISDMGSLRFRNYILLELPDVRLVVEKARIFGGGILTLRVVYRWCCKKRHALTEGRIFLCVWIVIVLSWSPVMLIIPFGNEVGRGGGEEEQKKNNNLRMCTSSVVQESKIFQKSSSHFHILGNRMMTWSMFHTEDSILEWPMNFVVIVYFLFCSCEIIQISVSKRISTGYVKGIRLHRIKWRHLCTPSLLYVLQQHKF